VAKGGGVQLACTRECSGCERKEVCGKVKRGTHPPGENCVSSSSSQGHLQKGGYTSGHLPGGTAFLRFPGIVKRRR